MKRQNALYIVATPIGNLADMTWRAVEVLKSVDIIAAEDTRHSAKLLQHYDISTPTVAYHDHGASVQVERLVAQLEQGKDIALISDAGTPLISDPGYRLVSRVRSEGFTVIPIPGACALVSALCASGLPSDRFAFEGFLPAKPGARKNRLESFEKETRTMVFYESPHRVLDSIQSMLEVFGEQRQIVLAREISKVYETFLQGSLAEVFHRLKEDINQQRGEIVIIASGYERELDDEGLSSEACRVMGILLQELSVKQAAAMAAKITGEKKNALYQWAISTQN